MKDLTGQKFGKLIVEKYSHEKTRDRKGTPYKERRFHWLCNCECGNKLTCDQYSLISGNTKSCGCLRRRYDLTGKTFGKWTVLKNGKSIKSKNGKLESRWWCQCSCGRKSLVRTSLLVRGQTSKCKNCRKAKISHGITAKYWGNLISGAKARGLEFSIDTKYASTILLNQENKCALSGVGLTNKTSSIDRIDSNKGYIYGNIQWVHKKVNKLKNNLSDDELIKFCHQISDWNKGLQKKSIKYLDDLKQHILVDGFPIVIDIQKSYGSWIFDVVSNKKYLDCFGNFGSQVLGWNWPSMIQRQNELSRISQIKIAHSDIYTEAYCNFVKIFSRYLLDFPNLFFVSGGTLGVENSLKSSFDWKAQLLGIEDDQDAINKLDVVHFENAFHGRSGYSLSLTNTNPDKTKWFPKFPWTRLPINDNSLECLENVLKKNNVASVIIEPILGEGGDIHVPKYFLESLVKLTRQYEALLIFDEVQTGFSTGKPWCYQHFDLLPDIIAFGKKIQTCGIACSDRIHQVKNNVFTTPSRINSTWGADVVDIVRSTIILETIEKEELFKNSQIIGDYFLQQLEQLNLENVRGRGVIIAFDLPSNEERDEFYTKLCKKVLCLKSGKRSIRFRPHLTISKEDVDYVIDSLLEII